MSVRGFQHKIVIYILGTLLILLNGFWLHSRILFQITLAGLYCILFYKGIRIQFRYGKSHKRHNPMDRAAFAKTYRQFRVRVALFWLAFVALCALGKWVVKIESFYFYGCTFFFLFLDRWFVNVFCLLQKFSDPKAKVVVCCCGCPCRGWDLMMIHTPLLFALQRQSGVENGLILLSSTLGVLSFLGWERQKYQLVEVRHKCKKSCDLKLCREHQHG